MLFHNDRDDDGLFPGGLKHMLPLPAYQQRKMKIKLGFEVITKWYNIFSKAPHMVQCQKMFLLLTKKISEVAKRHESGSYNNCESGNYLIQLERRGS